LSKAVVGVVALAEGYPQLKANQNFLALQHELVATEDRIAAGRRFYNGNVRALNTRVEAFPSNIVAGMFHFSAADYFELDDPGARQAVSVDLGGSR
jgi:LemA protein